MAPMSDTSAFAADDSLVVAGRRYRSRLLTGTGKFRDFDETRRATEAVVSQTIGRTARRAAEQNAVGVESHP